MLILSTYFKYSNQVDLHNQARQYDLALEKKWVTQDAYFRLYTTLIGMTVTDSWKAFKFLDKKCSISHFADVLALDMLEQGNAMKQQEMSSQNTVNSENSKTASVDVGALTSCSSVSMCKEIKTHTQVFLAKKRQVRCIWCSRVRLIERKTTMICKECGKGFAQFINQLNIIDFKF